MSDRRMLEKTAPASGSSDRLLRRWWNKGRQGFTLVELLVVIAVIGVLIAILLPAVQAARESARKSQCRNNLRQLGVALQTHHDGNLSLPPGWVADLPDGIPGWGWASRLLPELEQLNLYNQIRFGQPIDDDVHQSIRETSLSVMMCPSDGGVSRFDLPIEPPPSPSGGESDTFHSIDGDPDFIALAKSNYVGVFGTQQIEANPAGGNGVFYFRSTLRLRDVKDGLSNTLFVGERSSRIDYSTWVGVVRNADHPMARVVGSADQLPNHSDGHFNGFSSRHPQGALFLLGDGSVKMLFENMDLIVFQAAATRARQEAELLDP